MALDTATHRSDTVTDTPAADTATQVSALGAADVTALDTVALRSDTVTDTPPRRDGSYWRDNALCTQSPRYVMDYDVPSTAGELLAKGICGACPVRTECLDGAMREEQGASAKMRYGIRGGLTPNERWNLGRPVKPGQPVRQVPSGGGRPLAECGTAAAYDRHRRKGEECAPCEAGRIEREAGVAPAECGTAAAYARHRRQNEACAVCDAEPPQCGTTAAYARHRRRNEACTVCDELIPQCGTTEGYLLHRSRKERACDLCRAAYDAAPPCGSQRAAAQHRRRNEPMDLECHLGVQARLKTRRDNAAAARSAKSPDGLSELLNGPLTA